MKNEDQTTIIPTIKKLVTGIPMVHSKILRIKAAKKEISVNELIRQLIANECENNND